MTNEQMAELAARLRRIGNVPELMAEFPGAVAAMMNAADLIESMAQRAPLTEQQIRESFEHTVHGLNLPLDRLGDGYRSTYTNIAWQVAFGTANRLHRSMAQRVPLTPRQMVEGLYQAQQADSDISDAVSFLCGAEWAEKHHGIRSEKRPSTNSLAGPCALQPPCCS